MQVCLVLVGPFGHAGCKRPNQAIAEQDPEKGADEGDPFVDPAGELVGAGSVNRLNFEAERNTEDLDDAGIGVRDVEWRAGGREGFWRGCKVAVGYDIFSR